LFNLKQQYKENSTGHSLIDGKHKIKKAMKNGKSHLISLARKEGCRGRAWPNLVVPLGLSSEGKSQPGKNVFPFFCNLPT
jgi:hypothetical protein